MTVKINKTNSNLDFLNARLDEVGMSSYERLRAKASLARAEAVAEVAVEIINLVKRLLKILVVRPYRRLTASVGSAG
jgi:hypothetical protein